MEKKFCCNKLRFLYSGEKYLGINVRVIKLDQNIVLNGNLSKDKAIMLTAGYSGDITECEKKILINYCPFCGSNLKYLTKNENYFQEVMKL